MRSVAANQSQKVCSASGAMPSASLARARSHAPAAASAASSPSVCEATYSYAMLPLACRYASSAVNSSASLPGRIARCRSATSQLAVRRGSITTTRMPGRARLAASMRWYSTGWVHAAFEPVSTSRSQHSRSS